MGIDHIRREFEEVLPRIETHAGVVFRFVPCPHRRAELIAETIALSWLWWLRLRRHGTKDPRTFVSALARYAAQAARSGRRLCGQESTGDALSPLAQTRQGFLVSTLPVFGSLSSDNPLAEALRDNTQTPVAEQVAFRLDFPAWLATYDDRRRRVIEAMMQGERTQDLAEHFQVSTGRISQLRREFLEDWQRFHGEC